MKIYLDTDILNKIADGLWKSKEDEESFNKIKKLKPDSFYVSQTMTLREINNINKPVFRKKVLDIYNRMNKISLPSSILNFSKAFSTQDSDRTKLRKLLTPNKDENPEPGKNYIPHFQNKRGKQITGDADHVYYSCKSGCDYFLTVDRKTIIRRYDKNRSDVDKIISPMKIVDPPALLNLIINTIKT